MPAQPKNKRTSSHILLASLLAIGIASTSFAARDTKPKEKKNDRPAVTDSSSFTAQAAPTSKPTTQDDSFAARDKSEKEKAADKDKRTQSDAAREVIDKQKAIGRALGEKLDQDKNAAKIEELRSQLKTLNDQLVAEQSRGSTAQTAAQTELQNAQTAGDKKAIEKAEKALKKEKKGSEERVAELNKKIAATQKKLDAAAGN